MNKKPIELHLIDGTENKAPFEPAAIPQTMRSRVPPAEWMDNPAAWNKKKFIDETAEFLHSVYGIGCDQDKHTLTMLADHIETYIQCNQMIAEQGLISVTNDGKTTGSSPFVSIRQKTVTLIIQMMNELGLTPRSRLAAMKKEDESPAAKFARGPKG